MTYVHPLPCTNIGKEASMTPTKLLYIYTVLKAFVVPLRSFRFISYNCLLVEVE